MQNICNGWNPEEFPYIDLTPNEGVSEAHRAWQGCPTVAVTRGSLRGGLRAGRSDSPLFSCISDGIVL